MSRPVKTLRVAQIAVLVYKAVWVGWLPVMASNLGPQSDGYSQSSKPAMLQAITES